MYECSKFFLRHSNETLAFPITVGKFFFNKCVPIGPCVPTGTFTLRVAQKNVIEEKLLEIKRSIRKGIYLFQICTGVFFQ